MKREMLFRLIILFVIVTKSVLSDGIYPKSEFFFAHASMKDNTFYIILDGSFHYQNVNPFTKLNTHPEQFGSSIESPTLKFKTMYMDIHFQDCHNCPKCDIINSQNSSYHEIVCDEWKLAEATGVEVGQKYEIVVPRPDASGPRMVVEIDSLLYATWDYPTPRAYLVAKTKPVENISLYSSKALVAIYLSPSRNNAPHQAELQYSNQKLLERLPLPVSQVLDSLKALPTFEKSEVIPLHIKTKSRGVEIRYYCLLQFEGGNSGTRQLILDQEGNECALPKTYSARFDKPVGLVRTLSRNGAEELLVTHGSLNHSLGSTIFRIDMNGQLHEIVSLITPYD